MDENIHQLVMDMGSQRVRYVRGGAPLQTYLHGGSLNATLFGRMFVPGPGSLR